MTALHLVAAEGDVECTAMLLQRGAEVNAADGDGMTPAHVAAYFGRLNALQLLLDFGADRTARDKAGSTAVDLASLNADLRAHLRL